MKARRLWMAAPVLALVAAALGGSRHATADDAASVQARERCATRLAGAIFGRGATADQLASPNPQAAVDAMLQDPQFTDRFARFLNSQFNRSPGMKPVEDAPYYLAKKVLDGKLTYDQLFVGPFNVVADAQGNVTVQDDPNGLGYFRSPAWLVRYAGNESSGLKISTGYHILNNTVGLTLTATTNGPDVDVTSTGRAKSPCNGCHMQNWYALDSTAKVLTRRVGTGDTMTFTPPTDGPQQVADKTVSNDKELVQALVGSTAFRFNACRLSFRYLYGRDENACESQVFDACMKTFQTTGMIQSAVATVAKDPTFCQ